MFTYTGNNVQETPVYKIPPIGDYTVQIIGADAKISRSGKDMIVLRCKIQHPEYKTEMFEYIVDNEYAQQRIFDILNSCGQPPRVGAVITPQSFVGLTGNVRIKHEEYNGETQVKINFWKRPVTPPPAAVAPVQKNIPEANGIPF